MIMRRWRGAVRRDDADAYLTHQDATGIREYRDTPGNRGVFVLTRPIGDLLEVVTLSLWDDMDAVRGFAGDDPERAKFYPGDDDLLIEKDPHADHWSIASLDLDPRNSEA